MTDDTDADPQDLAHRYPSGDADELPFEARMDRAADGLCEVILAIEDVDYNCLMEADLLELMEAFQTVSEICHHYRDEQHTARRKRKQDEADG